MSISIPFKELCDALLVCIFVALGFTSYKTGNSKHCIGIWVDMKTCKEGTSSGQLEGLPVTPDLPGFVAHHHCPFVLRLCPAFVVAFYQRICPVPTPPLWICPVCVAHLPPSFNRLYCAWGFLLTIICVRFLLVDSPCNRMWIWHLVLTSILPSSSGPSIN